MRLRSIWVESYGSLRQMTLPAHGELSDGINVFFGPNEAGKSQLKGFLEELFFPRPSARGQRDLRPFGRVEFSEKDSRYLLEVSRKGLSSQRRLYLENRLSDQDISDLFPSLRTGGNEVFSSLYSFGLDDLLASSTSGSRILSEHLFGAIASGKGIAISSVIDSLDEEIKKLGGRDARVRSLTKVLDELELANKQRNERVADEEAFINRYKSKEELGRRICSLEDEYDRISHELKIYNEVQRLTDGYDSYLLATRFVERYPNLSTFSPDLLRSIENLFQRIKSTKASIEEVTRRRDAVVAQLQPFDIDTSLVDRAESVRVARKINYDLVELLRDLNDQKSEFHTAKSAIEERSLRVGIDLGSKIGRVGEPSLKAAVEVLERLRGSLDSLERQTSDYRPSPLEALSTDELRKRLERAEDLIQKVGELIARSDPLRRLPAGGALIRGGTVMLFGIIAAGALYVTKTNTSSMGVLLESSAAIVAALLVLLAAKGRGRSKRQSGGRSRAAMNQLGLERLDRRALVEKLDRLQNEKRVLDSVIRLRAESGRIAGMVRRYGLKVDEETAIESIMEQVTQLVQLMHDASDLDRTVGEIGRRKRMFEERKLALVSLLNADFPELRVPGDPSPDLLDVIVSDLVGRLTSSQNARSEAERLERDVIAAESEIGRFVKELDGLNECVDELLFPLGYSYDSLDEDLLDLMRRYGESRSQSSIFMRSAESVFGEELKDVLPHFSMARVELTELIGVLRDRAREIQKTRDELLGRQAEVVAEERRLFKSNSVAQSQALIESLTLEAEELSERLRRCVVAKQLLRNANARFEELHQPELLRLSSEIFSRVTQGRYVAILKKEGRKGDSIFARNSAGEDVVDAQLSRGTREQLYISIRLALITRPNALDLPLLMDDVMVNADIERAQGLVNELSLVARDRQILYFCSKPEVLNLFESVGVSANVLEMARL